MLSAASASWRWHQYAPGCHVLELPQTGGLWVFGMRWLPTVGSRSRKLLLCQLYREKVRWWIGSLSKPGTIGFLPASQGTQIKQTRLRCAAMQFAIAHPQGVHLLRIDLDSKMHWLVAVNEGNVLSQTDSWFDDSVLADELEQSICQRFPGVRVTRCNLRTSGAGDESVLAFLADPAVISSDTYLRRLHSPWLGRIVSVRALLLLLLLAWLGWRYLDLERPDQSDLSTSGPARAAGAGDQTEVAADHRGQLVKIAAAWSSLPVNPQGWALHGVSCRIQTEMAQCRARYDRLTPGASNLALELSGFHGWSIRPISLDRTDFERMLLLDDSRQMDTPPDVMASWLIQLQQVSGLTYAMNLANRGLAETTLSPAWRALHLTLPLRHLHRVDSLDATIRWKQIHLEVVAAHVAAPGVSRLRVHLEGDVFDKP